MPPESLTVAVTSSLGIGIIAGIVSGVCYILVHGFSVNRPRNHKNQWNCSVCGERFRSIGGVLDRDKVVDCLKCGGKVCQKKCSNQDKEGWICLTCENPESWFKGILKSLHPNSYDNRVMQKMDPNKFDEVDEDLEALRKEKKEQVRDFIERLVEGMLGGSIDNASIGRLYSDKDYLPVVGQSPCSTHAGLKLLIQRIIQEAIGLPTLKKVPDHPGKPAEEINRTYEDLLATAIINKVIENYQDELPSSSANSVSSRRSNLSTPNNKEYYFGEETLDAKWRNCNSATGDADTTSVSSVEEWVRSDSSTGSTKYVDHASLTIHQRIEEALSSDEEQILQNNKGKEWKENWRLQKRQFAGTASPIPVPMLVPNPTVEAKVLIGDREAEDTTDLSDAGSENGDTERVEESLSKSTTNQTFVIQSDEIENQVMLDRSTDDSQIVREHERILEEFISFHDENANEGISETINQEIVNQTETVEYTSLDSHIEQDTEYTEKYATLPRTIFKCSTPIKSEAPNVNDFVSGNYKSDIHTKNSEILVNNEELSIIEDVELREMFKGTYSEREKQKWQNAVEMKNNPYTEENINRRLHQISNTPAFGRDYYVKEAARATGARKNNVDDVVSGKLQESTNQSNVSDSFIFKAVPAVVDADGSIHTSIESPTEVTSSLLEISSDSDLSVERTYNLTSGKVYEKIGNVHKEIINTTPSPEGIRYTSTNTEIDGTATDENHNAMTQDRKRTFLNSLTEEHKKIDSPITPSVDVFSEKSVEIPKDVPLKINYSVREVDIIKKANVESIDYVDNNNKTFTIQEVSMDFSTEGEDVKSTPESSLNSNPDTEIVDLNIKHLVKDRLGQFSKSYPNLSSVPLRKVHTKLEDSFVREEKHSSHESLPQSAIDVPVNYLKKRFSSSKEEIIQKQIHSLTARSISQVIRKELQEIEHQEHSKPVIIRKEVVTAKKVTSQANNVTAETVAAEELPIFPNAKSRISFFENLNR